MERSLLFAEVCRPIGIAAFRAQAWPKRVLRAFELFFGAAFRRIDIHLEPHRCALRKAGSENWFRTRASKGSKSMKRLPLVLLVLGFFAMPVSASNLEGVWLTPPDAKSTTGHVQIAPCGAALCGTVTKAFDKNGKPINTIAVGRRVLSGVNPADNSGGTVYVPIMKQEFPVKINVNGNKLELRACNAAKMCKNQVWTRVK